MADHSKADRRADLHSRVDELLKTIHPDITDHHGRVWTWWKGDLYRHCTLAWPRSHVEDRRHGLPDPKLRNWPNYRLCEICMPPLGGAS
ncbi:hypothetical protein ACFV1H_18705 [Streptomyces virginiae]|uniref:hypothetical protein n=1 Tax=Streptomyces virginiae TaxID=1961 RepID=UPI003691DEE7